MPRRLIVLLSLAIMLLGAPPRGLASAPQSIAHWEVAPPLATPRAGGFAIATADGAILLYGGNAGAPASQRYSPTDGSTRAVGVPTWAPGAVAALADGRLLLSGGGDGVRAGYHTLDRAELYDPTSGVYTAVAPLATSRNGHSATTLRDGMVLFVGGHSVRSDDGRVTSAMAPTAERFDPRTGRWSPAGRLAAPRGNHTATLLPDGRVLAVGGVALDGGPLASAELYDPATNSWTTTGALGRGRSDHRAVALADGSVLILDPQDGTAERYDLATGRWSAAGALNHPRGDYAVARLADGRVLVAGGHTTTQGGTTTRVTAVRTELYDPTTGAWSEGPPLPEERSGGALIPLPDGGAVIVGGRGAADEPLREVRRLTVGASPERCFAETGQCLRGRFLAYWEAHGGLALNGYPLGPEQAERLEDGREHLVQYFERARLEYHPANAAPYDVLLGQFGRQVLAARLGSMPPVTPLAGARFFPETGHNLADDFRAYWEASGGLAQFGLPLSETFTETLEDGRAYPVQYFERARFERHAAPGGGTIVLLGQFGRAILTEYFQVDGRFRDLYTSEATLRARLGPPTVGALRALPGEYLPFPNGAMLRLAPERAIIALCLGTEPAPAERLTVGGRQGPYARFTDSWSTGQPRGGAPLPQGGYEPPRGFGTVWREQPAWRACLGPLPGPESEAATFVVQSFRHGELVQLRFREHEPDAPPVVELYAFLTGDNGQPTLFAVAR